MFRISLILLALIFAIPSFAQEVVQTIRGKITDSETHQPLPGASVILTTDTSNFKGVTTDINGYYELKNIPIGRQSLKFTFIGYETVIRNNVVVTSGKEVILNIEMTEQVIEMDEVEITATDKTETNNEMSVVSARQFSVEETERYAGSRGDPARMASNFAGVQGADDSRNDIVIRGNSPMSVLWRVEGVDIPNPNHFAIAGTAGGPVSILNNKSLSNSDFFSGAFPADYGNTISGVFDLKMRAGNPQSHEFTGQFGFLGTEIMAEGPIKREKHSSYIAGYRYSTLDLFSALNIQVGTEAIPKYQDGFFKVNLPSQKGGVSLFGIGGYSSIDILVSEQEEPTTEIYGIGDRDQRFNSGMGVFGASFTRSFNKKSYGKLTIAQSGQRLRSRHTKIYRHLDSGNLWVVDSTRHKLGYNMQTLRTAANGFINKKYGKKHVVKYGWTAELINYSFTDSILLETQRTYLTRLNSNGQGVLAQPYVSWKYRINPKVTTVFGLHSQYFSLNNSFSPIEPRLGLKWELHDKGRINAGLGLHSQLQPGYIYFHNESSNPTADGHNRNLGFTRSVHSVAGYDHFFSRYLRLKTEVYYQYLFDIPIGKIPSSFSMINQGTGFVRFFPDELENKGVAQNYGVELTVERFFHKKYLLLGTVSLFESRYRGSDNIWRDTDFNGNYVYNLLASREFKTGDKSAITLGTKITGAGGRRYSPVDTAASNTLGEIVYENDTRNSLQLSDYFRWDLKINFRINAKKVTHEIALDLVNVLGTKNVLKLTYAPDPSNPSANPIREEYQLGFLPIFYYKIDF